jgi:DNA repair protein RecN (Recombination protein N)
MMLTYLRVENFAVVEKVELFFGETLNVLTGETGTGKSILIDALLLFLNKKVSPTSMRGGSKELVVEAQFSRDDQEYILRRELRGEAKKKSFAYINGQLAPFDKLKELAQQLLNIYGQHDHMFLLNHTNHRLFLDHFGKTQPLVQKLSVLFSGIKGSLKELDHLKKQRQQAREKLDFLHFQINEIEELGMDAGEDDHYEQRLTILSSAEEIMARSEELNQELYEDEGSVYNVLARHRSDFDYLEKVYPELSPIREELDKFYNLLPELSSLLASKQQQIEYDENEVKEVEDKVSRLNHLKKKYSLDLNGLLKKMAVLKQERDLLLNVSFSITDKEREIDQLLGQYRKLNQQLREERYKTAEKLSGIIEGELTKLEMKQAQFITRIQEVEPEADTISDRGTDQIEFYFSPNPGQVPGPIKDVASGGELSRLMLVLKSILNEDRHATYIFDEIDTGIGGKTAEFVGEKLKAIAGNNQVICISHLPQIASFADRHFLIQKEFRDNKTFSFVNTLSPEERIEEIARLMAGSAVNADVRNAARNLLSKNQ